MTLDKDTLELLAGWAGRSENYRDTVTPAPVAAMAATLDRDDVAPLPGMLLPPLWHWLYFLPVHRQSELGEDGHARRGGFLPPVPLPRRMWAGGRLRWHAPVHIGDAVTRHSKVVSVSHKAGRSGELVFVLVRHEIHTDRGLALTEEHDIVYRGPPDAGGVAPQGGSPARGGPAPASSAPKAGDAPAASTPASASAAWQRTVNPDPVLLFRYSALTFNGHRIHYDRSYVTQVEGYPGLVVHGPLLATLLADLLRRERPDATLRSFDFRALRPVFDTAPFTLCGQPDAQPGRADLWVRDADGALAMQAHAAFD